MSQTFLPRQDVALTDSANRATTPFYVFLQALEARLFAAGVTQAEFDALVARVEALEQGEAATFIIQGFGSISVAGTPQSGVVQLSLQGDTSAPGSVFVYGTDSDGAKGWYRLFDQLDAPNDGIAKLDSGYLVLGEVSTPDDLPGSGSTGQAYRVLDVSPGLYAWDGSAFTLDPDATGAIGFVPDDDLAAVEGLSGAGLATRTAANTWATREIAVASGELTVSNGSGVSGNPTLGLADVADAGGGTLQKTDFDAKGRKTGTSTATTDDLDEGSTNLYFTDERAQDAVGNAVDGTGDVPLSYNDTTGAISAALSSGVQASLDLADTAVQPDDFSGALVTLSGNQSIPDSTGTMLSFGAEAYDQGGYFDAGAPTRLTVPADGIYVASASAVFVSNATGYRQLQLFRNGASFVGRPLSLQPAVSGIATGINCDSAPTYCSAGDYFEAQVTQTSGGALNVLQNNATWFAIRRLATT